MIVSHYTFCFSLHILFLIIHFVSFLQVRSQSRRGLVVATAAAASGHYGPDDQDGHRGGGWGCRGRRRRWGKFGAGAPARIGGGGEYGGSTGYLVRFASSTFCVFVFSVFFFSLSLLDFLVPFLCPKVMEKRKTKCL
jgi:hypothetical protein